MLKRIGLLLLAGCLCVLAQKTTENVRVSTELHADLNKVRDASGGLVVRFTTESTTRKVIAYAWSTRKLRKSRIGTDELDRENYKPRLAKMSENGRVATFEKLPPDFYDLCVVDFTKMTLHEGMTLHHLADADNQPDEATRKKWEEEITKTICGSRADGIGAWEGFFDRKIIHRFQFADEQAGIMLQQMREATAVAESGTQLAGSVHSVDVVWVQRTIGEGHGWQVIQRQQLYRGEIEYREFFKHKFMKELCGIRIGMKVKKLKKEINLK